MNYRKLYNLFLCAFLLTSGVATSKEFDHDFLKKHLNTTGYAIDSGASAVVLYENTYIDLAYNNGGLGKRHLVHKLIKILKAEALDAANVHVWYTDKDAVQLNKIKGYTYNLQDGKLITSTLAKQELVKKDVSKTVNSVNFTMPDVKVGSLIEYSYETYSNDIRVSYTWLPQGPYPVLENIFSINYPLNMEFTSISHIGLKDKRYMTEEEAMKSTDDFAYVCREYAYSRRSFWVRRNVEKVTDETFVRNKYNMSERLEMQLTGVAAGIGVRHFYNSWDKINRSFWIDLGYRDMLNGDNSLLDKTINSITKPGMTETEIATAIYKYVRDHYKCRGSASGLSTSNLGKLADAKDLNQWEMNMLLTAMLVRAKLPASLVLLGTAGYVSPTEAFPLIDRINYMVCQIKIDSQYLYLDASNKYNVFGSLPSFCYNGFSWVLADTGHGIQLTSDHIKNKTVYNFKLYDFTDSTAKIDITRKMGTIASANYRRSWAEDKEQKTIDLDALKDRLPGDIAVQEKHIENEDNPDTTLVMKYSCIINFNKNEPLFLNTNLIKIYENNPFKVAERRSPIEFNYKSEYVLYTNITLPVNMEPDTLSEPMAIQYHNGDLYYKKIMSYLPDLHILTINTSFNINTTTYGAEEYSSLKEFFQKMIDDTNEMLAIKKTKK
ncbi:DUF3857 domain-containing protein [Flavipsychrobacter stenotrophus]|uniref:DUF3857 domain-containing protein n=1 Tax=Flavipsychrobacter stenotrophus TaxID=2077091 RepID=UPI00137519CC|nr:DUF3857 domain-containing protein [Flavipsychrobacter stenotrophus]